MSTKSMQFEIKPVMVIRFDFETNKVFYSEVGNKSKKLTNRLVLKTNKANLKISCLSSQYEQNAEIENDPFLVQKIKQNKTFVFVVKNYKMMN